MEAVRIRKAGFALRLPHEDFVSRYGILMGRQAEQLKQMQPKPAADTLVWSSVMQPSISSTAYIEAEKDTDTLIAETNRQTEMRQRGKQRGEQRDIEEIDQET